jgi:Oligogalacturonate lyase
VLPGRVCQRQLAKVGCQGVPPSIRVEGLQVVDDRLCFFYLHLVAEAHPIVHRPGEQAEARERDEALLAGSFVERGQRPAPGRAGGLEARWAAHLPMRLYTVRIKTGEIKTFHPSKEWLNHVQFSPTDPTLMMFCHEGPWHKVDRIWTIRTDGTGLRKIHTRSADMEIAGHEFFSADGKTVWYDLQTPKGKEFWLAGRALAGGETVKYRVEREHWSVHYNASPGGA